MIKLSPQEEYIIKIPDTKTFKEFMDKKSYYLIRTNRLSVK